MTSKKRTITDLNDIDNKRPRKRPESVVDKSRINEDNADKVDLASEHMDVIDGTLTAEDWNTLQWSLGILPIQFEKIRMLEEPVRRGGYGEVRIAEWQKDRPQQVALKRNYHSTTDIMDEVLLLELAQGWHNHIVQLLGVTNDPSTSTTWMVMEFAENGNLHNYLLSDCRPTTVNDKLELATGITRGLNSLHKYGILHGDFHSGNILIDKQGNPRITDFGLSRGFGMDWKLSNTAGGVVAYTAPEVLLGQPYT